MNTRTFRANSMMDALQAVQKELGSDAIVVSMRETEAGLWHKPYFEIVAAKPVLRKPAQQAAQPRAVLAEPKVERQAEPAAIDPALKESLAAVIKSVTEKNPAASAELAVQTPPTHAAMPKGTRPFKPEVLSKRVTTRTWIVSDDEAREDFRPEETGKQGPALAPAGAPASLRERKVRPFIPEGTPTSQNPPALSLTSLTQQRTSQNDPGRVGLLPKGSAKREPAPTAGRSIKEREALDEWERETRLPPPLVPFQVEARQAVIAEETEEPAALARLRTHLLEQGLDEDLVERLNRACADTLSPARLADAGYVSGFLKKQLLANLRPAIKIPGEGQRVICLIGTSGAGKTSVCAKLAAQFVLKEGKKVAWIEANTLRTGAIAEARMITESFGVDLHLVYGPEDLADALASTQDADLVLMDTAGCNPRRESSLVELGALITSLPSRITLLVTGATTKEADLKQTLAAFRPFSLDGLVVTRMDETLTFGSIYNSACRSKLPVAYYTSDPATMSGLSSGNGEILVNALFNEGI
jgi:flagellar biosynthesis GTPase FlhF